METGFEKASGDHPLVQRLEIIEGDLGGATKALREAVEEQRSLDVAACIMELTAANEALSRALHSARAILPQEGAEAIELAPALPRIVRSFTILDELEWLKQQTGLNDIALILAYAVIEQHERKDPTLKTAELAERLGVTQRTISNHRKIFIDKGLVEGPELFSGLFGTASEKLLACRSPYGVRSKPAE